MTPPQGLVEDLAEETSWCAAARKLGEGGRQKHRAQVIEHLWRCMYVRVSRVHRPSAIGTRGDWDQVPYDARVQRAPRGTGRLQYAGFSARVVPVTPWQVLSTPRASTSSRWRPLRCQGKLTIQGPDKPPRELQLLRGGINSGAVPTRG